MSPSTPPRRNPISQASASGAGISDPYSPSKRTGLVFTGTGVHGVYQAGVLKALQEAGVRVDVVAGHGVGAATALLAAIDGGSKLLDAGGLWQSPRAAHYYQWQPTLRLAAGATLVLAAVFAIPLVVLAAGAVLYSAGFILTLARAGVGTALEAWTSARAAELFSNDGLPTVVPRLVMLVVLAIALIIVVQLVMTRTSRDGMSRTAQGQWWWRVVSSPLDVATLRQAVMRSLWDLVRGAATTLKPAPVALSRRYCDVLSENLGQPGCRELMLAVTDLDARRDLVGALLSVPYADKFFSPQIERKRGAEVVDLAGTARDMVADLLGAALTPPIGAEPHPLAYPVDGYWRGETHRGCDRPGILARLLAELDAAGVVQVIVVSAAAPSAQPHQLRTPSVEPRARLGEFLAAAESAALGDAVAGARSQFDALYLISPAHNAVGPFDLGGSHDQASDRRRSLSELQQQGYDDAYLLFIEPIVGASGDQLGLH